MIVNSQHTWKLAAIDLDGTLLDEHHRIPSRNRAGIRLLQNKGVRCVIASGRMHEATVSFADELGLKEPIISYNGAMVKDPVTNEIWRHITMPASYAEEITRFCLENGYHLNYYLNSRLYIRDMNPWAKLYLDQTNSPYEILPDFESLYGTSPTKLILISSPDETNRLLPQFKEKYGDRLYITKSNPEYLEFMNPDATKASALEYLAHRLGVAREEVIAFGDGGNDLPMIQWAGMGVAMYQARAAVKEAADCIAPPETEGGLGAFIEQLFS